MFPTQSSFFLLVLLPVGLLAPLSSAEPDASHFERDEVELAVLLRLIPFVDWPTHQPGAGLPIEIGVWDSAHHEQILQTLLTASASGGDFRVVPVNERNLEEKIDSLDLLYCQDVAIWNRQATSILERNPHLLVVGASSGFLESGGIVNFLREGEKVAFEINNKRAKEAGIIFRSRLLRLAERVIQ